MLMQRLWPACDGRVWGRRVYCAGLALLLILSEVFSSNIQGTLPGFSHISRIVLTGGAVVLLLVKCLLLTEYQKPWQMLALAAALGYSAFATYYGGDTWFFLAVLAGVSAFGVDLRAALKVYLAVAVAGLLLVQLLHLVTPLVPFNFYCRNWDFGYGHYNGYGARLLGVFVAWAWLRWPRLRWFDWAGLAGLLIYTFLRPIARGAGGAMLVLLVLLALQKLLPKLFASKVWHAVALLVYPVLAGTSLWMGRAFDPTLPASTPVLSKIDRLFSGRLEIWHHVFWASPMPHPAEGDVAAWWHADLPNVITLLGGFATDGDEHHAIDNTFLALIMNKGVLGAVLITVLVLLLLWRLCRRGCTVEILCVVSIFAYLLMENKPFLISANPLFLLLPVLLTPRGAPLPVPLTFTVGQDEPTA